MNRAVQGDIVVVEVFDEKEWKAPADDVVDQECTLHVHYLQNSKLMFLSVAALKNDDAENSDDEGDDNNVMAREAKALRDEAAEKRVDERQPTGRIVGVIKRNWRA